MPEKRMSRSRIQAEKISRLIDDRLLTREDVTERFGLGKQTIYTMVAMGKLPSPLRIGRCVYWAESSIVKAFLLLRQRSDRNLRIRP